MMQDCYSKIVEKLSAANPTMVLQVNNPSVCYLSSYLNSKIRNLCILCVDLQKVWCIFAVRLSCFSRCISTKISLNTCTFRSKWILFCTGSDASGWAAQSYSSLGWTLVGSFTAAAHVRPQKDSTTGRWSQEGPKQQHVTEVCLFWIIHVIFITNVCSWGSIQSNRSTVLLLLNSCYRSCFSVSQ